MHSFFNEVAQYLQLPRAALAAGPGLRIAADRHGNFCVNNSGVSNVDDAFIVERISASDACKNGVCLFLPKGTAEVLVVSLQDAAGAGSVYASAEAAMWWVDRCVQEASSGQANAPLVCCVRMKEMHVERLYLYAGADAGDPAVPTVTTTNGVRHLRVPNAPFLLHMQRMVQLRAVHVSPSVSDLVEEVDVHSCQRWSQAEVNNFLTSLHAPLRAVRVPTVTLNAVALLRRFHASLRVLHLCRRTPAIFRDPHDALLNFDDEELEEDPSMPPSGPNSADTSGKIPPPPPPPPQSVPRAPSPTKAKKTVAKAKGKKTDVKSVSVAGRPRRSKELRQLPVGVTPVLEELNISSSARDTLPSWVQKCVHLQRLVLGGCRYETLNGLEAVTDLREVTVESCNNFSDFKSLCAFPQLQVLSIRNCALLRSVAWLPRLSGALRSLVVHHSTSNPFSVAAETANVGVGLDHVQHLSVSIPAMTALTPLLAYSARTMTELTLLGCLSVHDFSELPPLPLLEKVCVSGNHHMRNFEWLRSSPLLTEVRATQCSHLTSLTGLSGCPRLRLLEVVGASRLHDIDDLADCTALAYVDLSQCTQLVDVSVFRRMQRLCNVLLRGCVQLPREFDWIESCPVLEGLMLPSREWYPAANEKLAQLSRLSFVMLL